MKQLPYIFILIILLGLSACQREHTYPLAMQQAESLMNTRPDSALYLLQNMADTVSRLPDEAQMYYHLLTIQARDKQYITHTGDSLINRIVDFYEGYGDKDRLMTAYYYQGRVYRDMGDAPQALKAFQQAVDLNFPNQTLLAKIYSQMGYLYMQQGLHDEAIQVNRKSIDLYLLQGKRNKISYFQRDIARMYDAKNMADSALHYYKEACKTALTDGDSTRYYGILGELGSFYYEKDSFHLAKRTLLNVLFHREERKCSHLLPYLGYIYEKESNRDSAYYFYQKTLQYGSIRQQYYAYQNLFNMAKAQGHQAEANKYITEALTLKNVLEKNKQTETIAKVNSLYNYQHTKQENHALQMKQHQQEGWLKGLSILTLLLIIAYIVFITHSKNKQQKITIQQELHPETEAIETLQEKLEPENQDIKLSPKKQEELVTDLKNSIVYKHFYWAADDTTIKITHEDWLELQQAIDIAYPQFTKKLSELNPSFSIQAIQICCLIKIAMPSASIARILRRSRSAISLACRRYYEKIHHTEGDAEMFRKFIENL